MDWARQKGDLFSDPALLSRNAAVAEFDQAAQALTSASAELQQLVAQFQVDARRA